MSSSSRVQVGAQVPGPLLSISADIIIFIIIIIIIIIIIFIDNISPYIDNTSPYDVHKIVH